jgi:hypothetical protein
VCVVVHVALFFVLKGGSSGRRPSNQVHPHCGPHSQRQDPFSKSVSSRLQHDRHRCTGDLQNKGIRIVGHIPKGRQCRTMFQVGQCVLGCSCRVYAWRLLHVSLSSSSDGNVFSTQPNPCSTATAAASVICPTPPLTLCSSAIPHGLPCSVVKCHLFVIAAPAGLPHPTVVCGCPWICSAPPSSTV